MHFHYVLVFVFKIQANKGVTSYIPGHSVCTPSPHMVVWYCNLLKPCGGFHHFQPTIHSLLCPAAREGAARGGWGSGFQAKLNPAPSPTQHRLSNLRKISAPPRTTRVQTAARRTSLHPTSLHLFFLWPPWTDLNPLLPAKMLNMCDNQSSNFSRQRITPSLFSIKQQLLQNYLN